MNIKLILTILGVVSAVVLAVVFTNTQENADKTPVSGHSSEDAALAADDVPATETPALAQDSSASPAEERQVVKGGLLKYNASDPSTHTATRHPYLITKGETNLRALSVLEARTTKSFPERLSLYHKPKPFNLDAWKKDESAYLNVVEPGRIDQMADISAPSIEAIGSRSRKIKVCTVLPVQFKAAPNSPVSLVVTRGGIFTESKTNAVTVKSDKNGIATVHYYATRGTVHQTEIMAASPMNFGQASILVNVQDVQKDFDQAAQQASISEPSQNSVKAK